MIILAGLFAGLLAPYDPAAIDLVNRLAPPVGFGGSWSHPLGTDDLGRDLLSRLLYAARLSLLIAFVGTMTGAALGTTLGFIAAQFRGWVEDAIMALVDLQASMPFLIVGIAIIAFLGGGLAVLMIVICIYGWERYARLARALALTMNARGFAAAARSYGAPTPWIYWRHILPNCAGVLIVNVTLNFPETILLESTLSFLGLGVQPPTASLGTIMSYGRDHLVQAWWIAVLPGIIITLTTLSIGLLGDQLRDRLAPASTRNWRR